MSENAPINEKTLVSFAFMGHLFNKQQEEMAERQAKAVQEGKNIILGLIEGVQDKTFPCQKVAKNAFLYECAPDKGNHILLEYFRNDVNFYIEGRLVLTLPRTNDELLLLTVSETNAIN